MTYQKAITLGETKEFTSSQLAAAFPAGSPVPALVANAIRKANWFGETDSALRQLAAERESQQIRLWAAEIRADADQAWGEEFSGEIADLWDTVADAVADAPTVAEMEELAGRRAGAAGLARGGHPRVHRVARRR